jgi:hypothetical protein
MQEQYIIFSFSHIDDMHFLSENNFHWSQRIKLIIDQLIHFKDDTIKIYINRIVDTPYFILF